MSAESPNNPHKLQRPTGSNSLVVTPQEVTDPTILDSVAGFINEVVPTTYSEPADTRDQIQWAHFEQFDWGDFDFLSFDCDDVVPPALILILGYTTGIQIWAVLANGEATEILSWRHGPVRTLKILPNPYTVDRVSSDSFASKRPLIALCDNPVPGSPQAGCLSFVSLRTSEQVKLIKFTNPILDVLANKQSVVVTFCERIAVFDAFTLEDRLTITTCYPSPGIQSNPVTLGARWLAYAEKKLHSSKRSSGGNEGEGVQSYTATVLHAAKSLGRGLRELGETVANSLTGSVQYKPGSFPVSSQTSGQSDGPQKGIVTVLDIAVQSVDTLEKNLPAGAVIAHFAAHNEAVVCMSFDPSGVLLLTADKRGHDFHLFRIHPHPSGSSQAAVHHLYVLHRGDTSAKVQDMCFSPDSRWVAVSSLRGTTHVFAVTPYGGHVGVRTHTTPYVVNKMSRFHRSAGLTSEGRSNSPVSMFETPVNSIFPFYNPRYPPFPHPTIGHPLAQIRQPLYIPSSGSTPSRTLGDVVTGRQRLSSSSEEHISLRVVSCFSPPRAWLDSAPPLNEKPKPVESLFVMSCHGTLVQYDLDPHHSSSVPKERVCDDTPIELAVSAKAQWILKRKCDGQDVPLPMSPQNLALIMQNPPPQKEKALKPIRHDEAWLSQVEIVTHAGPHRRLWMGPQFEFKTYTLTNGSVSESRPIDVRRSKPVNMPVSKTNAVLIESSSAGSGDLSLFDTYHKSVEDISGLGELQLKEDLADAMQECHARESGGRRLIASRQQAPVAKVVNPLGTVVTIHSDDDQDIEVFEDSVIHENCDEALFRPVVVARPTQHVDNKFHYLHNNDIIVHPLQPTTEVAIRLPEKNHKNKEKFAPKKIESRESSPKPVKAKPKDVKSEKEVEKLTKNKSNLIEIKSNYTESKSAKSRSNQYINNVVNLIDNSSDSFIIDETKLLQDDLDISSEKCFSVAPKPKTKTKNGNNTKETTKTEIIKQVKEKKLKYSYTEDKSLVPEEPNEISKLDNTKNDQFGDTKDSADVFSSSIESKSEIFDPFTYKYQGLEPSDVTEEAASIEKSISKKPRKPKAKLGVRIPLSENSAKPNQTSDDSASVEYSLPQPKISYSSVAALKLEESEKCDEIGDTFEDLNQERRKSTSSGHKISYNTVAAAKPSNRCTLSGENEKSKRNSDESTQIKLSYNVVAATKQEDKVKPPFELESELDLSLIECVEHFTVKLPKKSRSDASKTEEELIDIDSPPEITVNLEDSIEDFLDVKKDVTKDKSDDEKQDSVIETTESDDSTKMSLLFAEEQTSNADKEMSGQMSKTAKRKAKKKRK